MLRDVAGMAAPVHTAYNNASAASARLRRAPEYTAPGYEPSPLCAARLLGLRVHGGAASALSERYLKSLQGWLASWPNRRS
jgi:hypothetical protein